MPDSTPTLAQTIATALAEDLGDGDVTTAATVPAQARAHAVITQKAPGVVFGLDAAEQTFRALDPSISCKRLVVEGRWRQTGPVIELEGHARALLSGERTALNFLQRLSGVATMAARCVAEIEGTGARILDTRKTTPGLRKLEKAAVAAGGGTNHRMGLFDAFLIKENHIAAAGNIAKAVYAARKAHPELPIEVEVENLDDTAYALGTGADQLLLDNMDPPTMRAAVELREVHSPGGKPTLEASGNVNLQTVREIAETGVDFISIGALTHSAPALDFSLLLSAD